MGMQLQDAKTEGEVELMTSEQEKRLMPVYISGPMSNMVDGNYPAFMKAEAKLRAAGYENIINPAVTGTADTLHLEKPTWHDFMASAVKRMEGARAIFRMPGRENSFGSRIEDIVAERDRLVEVEL